MGGANTKLTNSDITNIMKKTKYTKEDIERLNRDFIDASKSDGKAGFSQEEFINFFKVRFREWDRDSMIQMFKLFDSDKNGVIDFKEFTSALFLMTKAPVNDKLGFLFDVFDTDRSGYLSEAEVEKLTNTAVTCGTAMGCGAAESYEYTQKLVDPSKIVQGKGISKELFIKSAAGNDKFCRMICFYDSFGDLLY